MKVVGKLTTYQALEISQSVLWRWNQFHLSQERERLLLDVTSTILKDPRHAEDMEGEEQSAR